MLTNKRHQCPIWADLSLPLGDAFQRLHLLDIHASIIIMSTKTAQELLLRHPQQRLDSPSRGTSAALHV